MRDFRSLQVWEKSHRLALEVYRTTQGFPPEERYGLTSQLRRAGVSVPSNIAEGCGRDTKAELVRFLQIAAGSASEMEYQFLLARDLGYLDESTYARLSAAVVEVKKMLSAYTGKVRSGGG
jgi:four helix bundle protein